MVVLLRLASRGAGVWDGLIERLCDRYTLVNIELGSPAGIEADPGAVLSDFADTVVAIASEIDRRPVHLLGWAGGTQIALQAAVRHPGSLASLILISPFREAGEMRQVAAGLDIIEALLHSGKWETYTRFWFMAGLSDSWIQANYDRLEGLVRKRLDADPFVSMDRTRAMHWMRALRRDWVSDSQLLRLRIPALVIGAGQNRWHAGPSREMAEALHRTIAGSRLDVWDALGPLLLVEAPDQVSERIDRFIRTGD